MSPPRKTTSVRRAIRRLSLALLLVACGSRTGLFVEDTPGPIPPADASTDGRRPSDDGAIDAGPDGLPPIDARPPQDVDRTDCPDAAATLIYVVTTENELYSFYPPDAAFKKIGNIACPAPNGSNPFSMAVDRKGIAYVVFSDGRLYRVSTATAACVGTSFQVGQQGFSAFGMGYATVDLGPAETLYIAGDERSGGVRGLGFIDTTTFVATRVGPFQPAIERAELTGTGDGRLFGFYTKGIAPGSFIGEVNKVTGVVVAETPLPSIELGNGWAFAFWGGDFYMFHAPDDPTSVVSRFRPADGTLARVTALPALIVGAGVSTCAPQQ